MKIFVACPAHFVTGGTEVLHQLVYKLREIYEVDAWIYYIDIDKLSNKPLTSERFEKYIDGNFVLEVTDDPENVMIIPEGHILLFYQFKRIKKIIWWLSVDNFFAGFKIKFQPDNAKEKCAKLVKQIIYTYPKKILSDLINDSSILLHLAQSEYARQFIGQHRMGKVLTLSDYINWDFFSSKNGIRKNAVLFNPAKGKKFTQDLIRAAPHIKWIPIQNMTPSQIAELMGESKVYIDFGNHPGKDRIPREAAINGCCVITNKSGAAKNEIDIPIRDFYKFEKHKRRKKEIIDRIVFCFNNYDEVRDDFNPYINVIRREEDKFVSDLKTVLIQINILH